MSKHFKEKTRKINKITLFPLLINKKKRPHRATAFLLNPNYFSKRAWIVTILTTVTKTSVAFFKSSKEG